MHVYRWRQKVYQLLVQQQSSDLTVRADLRKWEEIKGSLTGQVSDLRSRVVELESTVKEREAQISLLRNHIQVSKERDCGVAYPLLNRNYYDSTCVTYGDWFGQSVRQ